MVSAIDRQHLLNWRKDLFVELTCTLILHSVSELYPEPLKRHPASQTSSTAHTNRKLKEIEYGSQLQSSRFSMSKENWKDMPSNCPTTIIGNFNRNKVMKISQSILLQSFISKDNFKLIEKHNYLKQNCLQDLNLDSYLCWNQCGQKAMLKNSCMEFPFWSCLYAPVLWEELHNPAITGLCTCNNKSMLLKKKCRVFINQLKRVNIKSKAFFLLLLNFIRAPIHLLHWKGQGYKLLQLCGLLSNKVKSSVKIKHFSLDRSYFGSLTCHVNWSVHQSLGK
jgi:hypothetical protein